MASSSFCVLLLFSSPTRYLGQTLVKTAEEYNFGVDASYVESMLEELNMSALKSSPTLEWERRETDEKEMLASEQRVYPQIVGKLFWIDRTDMRCGMRQASSSLGRASGHGHEKHQVNPAIPPWKPWDHDSAADDTQPGSCKTSSCGSVLTYGDSDWAGDADLFSVSGAIGYVANLAGARSKHRAENSQRSHSAVAKLSWSAALSGAREGMSLRQQWNWQRQFGSTDDEAIEASQQILCCDSCAALGMIRRKGSTRKTRHIELNAFFPQQWSARPKVRLVQVVTSEMLADRHHIRYISRDSDWTSNPVNRIELGRKDRAEKVCRNSTLIFDKFVAKISNCSWRCCKHGLVTFQCTVTKKSACGKWYTVQLEDWGCQQE